MEPQINSPPIDQIITLQQILSLERTLLLSQNQQKSKYRQSIQESLKKYFTFYTSIIKRITSNQKLRISEEDVYGNTYNFVKEVTLLVSKDYTIMEHLLETQPDNSKLQKLIPSIVNILYENPATDDFAEKDITKLMTDLGIKQMTSKLTKLEKETISEFMRRPECRRYGQIVAKSLLLMLSCPSNDTRKITDAHFYNEELFPKLSRERIQMDSIQKQGEEVQYFIKDYLNTITNSQFHVPVSVRVLFKSIELEKKHDEDKLFQYYWHLLSQIYSESLKYPEEYEKTIGFSKTQIQNLSRFRQQFHKFTDYLKLDEANKGKVKQFLKKLLVLPSKIVKQLEHPPENKTVKLYTSCFSVQQTIILLQSLRDTPNMKDLNQKIATRVSRIYQMSEEFADFSKAAPVNEIYCIFYQLVLPKSIDIDYMKKYDKAYNEDKSKSLIRQILTTIQPLQVYLSMYPTTSFIQILRILSEQSNEETNTDKVAFFVNIKYFLWISEKLDINSEIKAILQQTNNNSDSWVTLFKQTKIQLANALYYLKGYAERTKQIDNKLRQTILHTSINLYLSNHKFQLCISSPTSRQKQFHTTGKLVIIDHERILMQKWESCVHKKLVLKDKLDKTLHVVNFQETINSFCSLEEVKNSVITGVDKVGINMNLFWFLSYIYDEAVLHSSFKYNSQGLKDYLEISATKTIFSLIFPKEQSQKDIEIHKKIHYFRFLQPKHLGLELNQIKPIWQLTNKHLNDLNKASSTIKKFDCLKEFMKVIQGILLTNQKTNKHRLQFIILYALLKSDQKQLASNIHFMQIYTDPSRMLSGEGAFIANLKAAIIELELLNFSKLINIDEATYNQQFQALEKQQHKSSEYIKQ